MSEQHISPLAGTPAPESELVDLDALLASFFDRKPDPHAPQERVSFGTNGHRGSSLDGTFNEDHILAIAQAICDYRASQGISGPLFLGLDTHALSVPAFDTALGVFAANGLSVRIASHGEFTPTPVISHAVVSHNRDRSSGWADGIVISPSHNPPRDGGFKYNGPNGGPADTTVTRWIEQRANALLEDGLREVRRMPEEQARRAPSVQVHDFLGHYVADLRHVVDFEVIRAAGLRMAVDPLGGAGVHYWGRIADEYGLELTVVNQRVDPRFAFMLLDWDGRIRMDPSSEYVMRALVERAGDHDIAFACDADHDRHGIVTPSGGLMPSNHYLAVLANEVFRSRPQWSAWAAIGKTIASSAMLDRVAGRLGRGVYEVPVGFKWFAQGLLNSELGLGCEESAGASVLRRDGRAWVTDKDGMVPGLLAAEIAARAGRDPAELYARLEDELGQAFADRVQAHASREQKNALAALDPQRVVLRDLAGDRVQSVSNVAPGNGQPMGGIKVVADESWFVARPSGTEDIYKVYAESFRGPDHLQRVLVQAQEVVDMALRGVTPDS